jgi:K+-sensing histidine kinase KdpD
MQRHIAQSAVARYGVAVASVILAVVPALWLRPLALAGAQFLLVAVLITGWVGGLWPALVAWGLAILVFKYYFTPPLDSLTVDLAELPRLIVFAVVALLMATVSAARRKAEDALKTPVTAWRSESASERCASGTWSTRSRGSCGKRTPRPFGSCS